ncbi:fimbrial biogenesis chaperone [Serratia aquatilis]|uniref:Molecular chaperone n=1 Tax=Serratia aquatilis TaxID=1737515 RepID=A0ABV6EH75_9GAMM
MNRLLFSFAMLAFSVHCFAAANMEIWPVTISFIGSAKNSVFWLKNVGSDSVSLQVRVLNWRQADGKNLYAEQNEVYTVPAFTIIPPQKKVPIRIYGINNQDAQEHDFKVIIDELPTPDVNQESTQNNIKIRMQYILPLFAYGQALPPDILPGADGVPKEKHHLIWSVKNNKLLIENHDKTHIKMTSVDFQCGKNSCYHQDIPVSYVLPNTKMAIELPHDHLIPATVSALKIHPSR